MSVDDAAPLAQRLLGELRENANPGNLEGMARYGISLVGTLGVPMPVVRGLAREAKRELGRDPQARHALAALLWSSEVHEARILASLIDEPSLVTDVQMEEWAADLDSWDVCDGLVNNLLRRAPLAWDKAVAWTSRDAEYVKRAGFVLGATLAVHDKDAGDDRFSELLGLSEREATDARNVVKKAVNWQLRQIGKRSWPLNAEAIGTCERILEAHPTDATARWIARDALRELRSEAVRTRLGVPG